MSLIRDTWCAVLRQCRPFEWYVLRCVCRVLYQLVPASLIRRCCYRAPWLSKRAVRRDSVALLEWLHIRPRLALYRGQLLKHAARHDAYAALGWLLYSLESNIASVEAALHKAARRGHLRVLVQIDSRLTVSAIERQRLLQRLQPAAVRGDHVHVLEWLREQCTVVHVLSPMYDRAVRLRRYAALHWLRSVNRSEQSHGCNVASACIIASRAGDLRALALLWEPDAVVRATLLDTQRWPDAALLLRMRDALHSSSLIDPVRFRQVLRCAVAHDHVEIVCAQPVMFLSACKWAHICCKFNAVRVLRWLATQQPVREWQADRHWPLLCDTAARRGHLCVLRVLRDEFSVPAPWHAHTMQYVALYAPKHCVAEILDYCAANSATQRLHVEDMVRFGRVEALRCALAHGVSMPRALCDIAATANEYAVLDLLHKAGVCPWPLVHCAPATLHVRDAARLLAPHLCHCIA